MRLTEGTADQEIGSGQIQRVPQLRHGVLALEDSVFLLTAVTGIGTE